MESVLIDTFKGDLKKWLSTYVLQFSSIGFGGFAKYEFPLAAFRARLKEESERDIKFKERGLEEAEQRWDDWRYHSMEKRYAMYKEAEARYAEAVAVQSTDHSALIAQLNVAIDRLDKLCEAEVAQDDLLEEVMLSGITVLYAEVRGCERAMEYKAPPFESFAEWNDHNEEIYKSSMDRHRKALIEAKITHGLRMAKFEKFVIALNRVFKEET